MSTTAKSQRIVSMDQFRGYTVFGMCVADFFGGYAAIHPVMFHNNNYFSYADSIMPSFMFAVGFSFRLTYLRRRAQSGARHTVWTYVRRALELLVVSLVMYGFGGVWGTASNMMPPEFEPFRPKAPATASFDVLLSKVREDHPDADPRQQIEAASRTGALILQNEPGGAEAKRQYEIARQAEQTALGEGQSYLQPAIERKHAWEALGDAGKRLVHFRIHLARLLKSNLWSTLAIIGVAQLLILPWIGFGFLTRFLVLVGLGALHCVLCYWFNWDFLYGINDNWMSKLWMTGTSRGGDGGFFGPISWAVAMMAGTLAYDLVVAARSRAAAAGQLILWGVAFMAVGYGMSCLSKLYERSNEEIVVLRNSVARQNAEKAWLGTLIERQQSLLAERRGPLVALRRPIDAGNRSGLPVASTMVEDPPKNQGLSKQAPADLPTQQAEHPRPKDGSREIAAKASEIEKQVKPDVDHLEAAISVLRDQQDRLPNLELAASPVLPPWEKLKGQSLATMLVEPPFVAPPSAERRPDNYWMMGKRGPNLSFITFASGFAFALYGLFVLACDLWGLSVGVFTTFGTNALVAYFVHYFAKKSVQPLIPRDSALWVCLAGFVLFFSLTYAMVRYLEKRNIHLRL